MRKARLLFTNACHRNCKGCCNKNWTGEPAKLITFEQLLDFDEIYITGGEPMLYIEELKNLINILKKSNKTVFLYTALPHPYSDFIEILNMVDGLTLTLHDIADYKLFQAYDLNKLVPNNKQLRLNVFPKIKINSDVWDVRPKIWIKDAPLPDGEEFVKLK
jgi:organic radical activating enzyme